MPHYPVKCGAVSKLDAPAAPRPARDPRLPAAPSGRLRDLRGRALAPALQRRGHHVTVLAADYDPARPHGDLTWRVHEGLPVVEVVNNWAFGRVRRPIARPTCCRVFEHVLERRAAGRPARPQPAQSVVRSAGAGARARRDPVVGDAARLHAGLPVGRTAHPPRRAARLPRRSRPDRCARCFRRVAVLRADGVGRVRRAPGGARLCSLGRCGWRDAAPAARRRAARTARHRIGPCGDAGRHRRRASTPRERVFDDVDLVRRAVGVARRGIRSARVSSRIEDAGVGLRLRAADALAAPAAARAGRCAIGFVGTLVWHKGVHVLIDAVRRLPAGDVRG